MDALHPLWLAARCALLLAGLLIPGAALMRALRVPRTVATSFAGSVAVLYALVLVFQLCAVRISGSSLTIALALVALGAHGLSRRTNAKNAGENHAPPWFSRAEWRRRWGVFGAWTPLYLVFWIAVLLRVGHASLAGPDVEFRWSYLAEQMLARGSLDFYPPQTAADFLAYFWAESIPPGVAALHAWAYACAGGPQALWTVPGTLLQLIALHELIWRAAQHFGGDRAARYACLAAAACPLLTWAVLLGQETGFTAVALTGLAFSLIAWRNNHSGGWAALAGVFAVLGASAREYGLVFPALAAVGFAALRADRRTWLEFGAVAAFSLIWPIRTWVLTGNPFYSLAVGELFPVNVRFLAWIGHDADALGGVLQDGAGWREAGRYLVLFAPAALFGWGWLLFSALRRGRTAWWGLVAVTAMLALWVTSVRYTNGGLFYSLRVASPALALGALAAGEALAATSWGQKRLTLLAPLLLGGLVLGTLPPTLALPLSHARTPWREWPAFATQRETPVGLADETVALVAKHLAATPSAARATVLSDAPGFQRRFAPLGIPVVPLWSPQVDWLFDPALPPAEAARRWRDSQVRYVIMAKWRTNLGFFHQRSQWQKPPFRVEIVGETASFAVFSLRADE